VPAVFAVIGGCHIDYRCAAVARVVRGWRRAAGFDCARGWSWVFWRQCYALLALWGMAMTSMLHQRRSVCRLFAAVAPVVLNPVRCEMVTGLL
jgi:hypothetical protein